MGTDAQEMLLHHLGEMRGIDRCMKRTQHLACSVLDESLNGQFQISAVNEDNTENFLRLPGCSKYASGVPGSLNHLLGQYGVLCFSIGLLGTWAASNNAAMFAEVVLLNSPKILHAACGCDLETFSVRLQSALLPDALCSKCIALLSCQVH